MVVIRLQLIVGCEVLKKDENTNEKCFFIYKHSYQGKETVFVWGSFFTAKSETKKQIKTFSKIQRIKSNLGSRLFGWNSDVHGILVSMEFYKISWKSVELGFMASFVGFHGSTMEDFTLWTKKLACNSEMEWYMINTRQFSNNQMKQCNGKIINDFFSSV